MKKKLSPKQWIGAVLILLLFILLTLFIYGCFHEDARFEKFINRFFVTELSTNPVTLHYTLADASKYGIDESTISLPSYHSGQLTEELEHIDETLKSLKKFHPERMSADNQYTYVLLVTYLTAAKECSSYLYFDEPLSPASGVQSELPILLAEYRISSIDDVKNYLSILSQIPDYLEGIILYEQEKADHGLFMSDAAVDKVIEQCMTIMDLQELKSGEHFLEITFDERLEKLVEQGIIAESEAQIRQSENERLLTTVVAPAYDNLADELTLLKGSGHDAHGLANYENGQKYYQAYLRLTTGSYHSIDEIKQMLSLDFEKNYTKLLTLIKEYPVLGSTAIYEENTFPVLTAKDMLSKLRDMMKEDYPDIPFSGNENASCTIKYVDDSLAPYTAPAFYMTPPIDNSSENTIYINNLETTDGLPLFTTLAHEGYPGHLYQTVYSQQNMQDRNISKLRSILYYGGYVEGWAMYTELNSYDYAIHLARHTQPETEYIYTADKLNRQIQLCLYSLLDIIIHNEGASYERVCQILKAMGFTDESGMRAVYEYIVEEPCNYLKYYLGYLEIMELKEKAKELWGPSFTPKRFHTFILNNGPADYRTLERLLN
ncbi:MAG: DUF885 domain-containing protein [Lachnospiraceae bacterium]|nr:DUF885 domain-containing protein [Lachnospiraceae bacterium]